ncbi:signal peptide peptidase SppA [Aquibium sp. LZ166]|uniref:Signal peptide peptidase SppA n=1 Tax=Aquibium pacificus TaxID=3153579 RepID=A0ABV3SFS5_9HYPH
MALRADDIIDRRRLRRKLTFWRVATLIAAAIAIAIFGYWAFGDAVPGTGRNHIAQVSIEGTIVEDEELIDRLERIGKADAVKGVILTIDSPGGTTAGGEAIFEAVRSLAEKKPVTAQVGTLAASAGYMIASATDHIVARKSSIVGSIGVLVQYPDLTGLMEKLGIGLESIKSSPLKAEPSPFNPTTEPERQMIRAMILDSYDWFVGLVTERRPLSREEVLALADGSVFTGRQALKLKLVDAVGGEDVAIEWLKEQGVDPDLEVIEWKKKGSGNFLFAQSIMRAIASAIGLPSSGADLIRDLGGDRIFLDGLLSLWQPDTAARRD